MERDDFPRIDTERTELTNLPNPDDAATLPATGGAYALLIRLRAAALLPERFGGRLGPGLYCYLGSAYGPGGIRARCRRHLQPDKPRRWHVDWLTTQAASVEAVPRPGLTECALAQTLLRLPGVTIPVAGFGSSDCRRCPAHLLRAAPGLGEGRLRRALLAA